MLRNSPKTLLFSIFLLTLSVGWLRAAANTQPNQAGSAVSVEQGRFKGIFEPVNFTQDINFTDVFFTSADEGWVSGEHATILHTSDGGKTWTAQVGGDPSGSEKPIGKLRFLDSRHGWAVTGDDPERLLRTMDGENWQQIGQAPVGAHSFVDYAFTSVRHGILLGGNNSGFYFTNDGGRHWQNVPCVIRATLQGLARTEGCYVAKLQMLSAQSGYALVRWSGGIAFLRTDDGGEHWTSIVNDVSECCGPEFFFTNLNHGVMVFNNGKTYITDDGARTWHALLSGSVGVGGGQGEMPIHFTDPEVGWVIGESRDNSRTFRVCYSIDGGLHWKTPQNNIAFPVHADHLKFNLTRRDRAYVIGDHGMIYRYRIVPANFTAANALPGPLMPGFDTTQVMAAASRVRQDIARLQQQIAAAGGGTIPAVGTLTGAGGATASTQMSVPDSVSTGFAQDTATATTPGPQGQATPPNASSAVGFTQDTAGAAAFLSDPTNANLTQGFTQSVDTSTPLAALQSCCGPTLQSLQTNLTGFNQAAAMNSTQFRSLNLIIAGVQFVTNLLNQTQQMRASFTALKRAPTLQAASGALQQLAATMNSTQKSVSTGFQNQGGWFAANAPASFVQDVGTGATRMATP